MHDPDLIQSYAVCEQISRHQAANFYPAFRVLPRDQRRALCALYAFFRICDDLSDEPGEIAQKRTALARWRAALRNALRGGYTHPIHPALHHAQSTFHVPATYLEAVIDGCEMDLSPATYATFEDLRRYCYHVASVVGLSCIHVWGFTGEHAKEYAEKAGIAFQLTNILRDLGEDAARGRCYLPLEDLRRFGYEPADWATCLAAPEHRSDRFRELMRFQVERARRFYDEAWPLLPLLRPAGRAVFLVMARTYRALLDKIERRGYDVFTSRVRLSRWQKLSFVVSALPVRLGWARA